MDINAKQKLNNALNVTLTVLLGIAVFVFIITFSIGLPIYCRFFYYAQINALEIPEITGESYSAIKQAYDQVLDFLTLRNKPFGTGVFKYSAEGASHFADCKGLFTLNTVALILSTIITALLLTLNKFKVIALKKPFGFGVAFTSAVSIFIFIAIIGGLVAIDFDKAFTIFHKLFFPGKENWQFDPYFDQIILALPEQFFLNCAILIGASVVILSVGIIVFELIRKKRLSK